jgi:hypothetical protein
MEDNIWLKVSYIPPVNGEVVMTKIDDENGVRNLQPLKKDGNLWWTPDGSMYVYYTPTHWKPLE